MEIKTNVYQVINLKNDSFYIGISNIKDPNYLGEGIWINKPYTYQFSKNAFQQAVKTYGVKSFIKIPLFVCENENIALQLYHKFINNKSFSKKYIYNISIVKDLNISNIYFYNADGGKINNNPNLNNFTNFEIVDASISGNCLFDGINMYYCSTFKDKTFDRARIFQIQTCPVYQYDFRTGKLKMGYDTQTIAEYLNKYSNITKSIKLKTPDKNGNLWSVEECDIFNSIR